MKIVKLILCLLLCMLTSCSSKHESVVCSTVSQDESVRIDIEYTYDESGKITEISKVVSVTFDQSDLSLKSLEEYYNELKEEEVYGVHYLAEMDKTNNTIVSITTIDLTLYDFSQDAFELGDPKEYESITKLIKEITKLGYYSCK